MPFRIRPAKPSDAEVIHRFVCALALYEREPDAVVCTPADFRAQLSEAQPPFEALIAELDGDPAGFALFFHNYSTWKGKRGIYLEDLFVDPEHRGHGVGRALLAELARIAKRRDCPWMEWQVLDWNAPARGFYENVGAAHGAGWLPYKIKGDTLAKLASE